ncbi:MAG TPA: hypothetical protein P5567_09160 [Kiritimatiellia bacterium]|nr:hypothetical protein [Kiritimatiellia bacterium]HRZ12610.1 hypothetical protein [Kiritimatiellia bacterium]HSA17688.1 hypothetical protein [Kiritimatiellia bacterium]
MLHPMNADHGPAGQTWIWRHFRLELPADWEMLQFSRDMEKGRCAFADRDRFRLEFDWRKVPGAPDFERMMGDYRARLESSSGAAVSARSAGAWHGLQVRRPHGSSSRFGAYFAENGCLVELVFLWPGEPEDPLERSILDGFAAEPETKAGGRRWRAFGLDCVAPASMKLAQCVAQPALAGLEFAGSRAPDRWSFRRLGLVPHWMKTSVGEWLDAQTAGRVQEHQRSSSDKAGHRMEKVEGHFIPRGLLQRRGRYEAAAWICPRDGRLYHAERIRPRGDDTNAEPPDGYIACCPGVRWPP